MTIRQLEKTFIDQLKAVYGFEEARNLAWLSISQVTSLNRAQYLGAKEEQLSPQHEALLLKFLDELKTGKPLQYVLGETEFYGLNFKVNPDVLIPRPETEELVDWIIKDVQKEGGERLPQFNVLDIGTGSGCIPISIKKNLPEIRMTSVDISAEAIKTAEINASMNKVKVAFIQDDILNPVHPDVISAKYDLIVSNPPYVTHDEKMQMHQNVLDFEPHTALFVENNNPLLFYKAIAIFGKAHLKENGSLYLEINENLGQETVELLRQYGFTNIQLRKDLRDSDRMIKAKNPSGISN